MAEYCEESVEDAFVAVSDCHTHIKEGIKLANVKEFRIVVRSSPGLEIDIKGPDPCDVVALAGNITHFLRNVMDKDATLKVMS